MWPMPFRLPRFFGSRWFCGGRRLHGRGRRGRWCWNHRERRGYGRLWRRRWGWKRRGRGAGRLHRGRTAGPKNARDSKRTADKTNLRMIRLLYQFKVLRWLRVMQYRHITNRPPYKRNPRRDTKKDEKRRKIDFYRDGKHGGMEKKKNLCRRGGFPATSMLQYRQISIESG